MVRKKNRGFTLIEAIIVVTILGIIAGVGVYSLVNFYNLWTFSTYGMDVLWSSRYLMRDLTTNLRQVRDGSSIGIATPTRFSFTDVNGNIINYNYSNGILQKNNTQIMSGFTSFAFTYYDAYNNLLTAPVLSPSTNIRYLGIAFTLISANQAFSAQTKVKLRNVT